MPRIAQRMLGSPPSATVRIADLAATLRRAGADVLDFSAGRASEHTPEYICEAAAKALADGDTHQTMAQGKPEYRAAVARKLERENDIAADPETEIIATMGCKQGLLLALMATIDPGDEIVVEDPAFVSYLPAIHFCAGTAVPVPLRHENGFRWDPDELASAITDRTRAILVCSPHNPTGVVHGEEDLAVIAAIARKHDLTVIVDEIYERLTWGGRRHKPIQTLREMAERTVGLMGVTKGFSMGGWRVGFAYAPAAVIESMVVVQQHLMTCVGSFAQAGAARAVGEPPPDTVLALWRDWEARCEHVVSRVSAMPGVSCAMPEGGFYAWIDVAATGVGSQELCESLLSDRHIALVPGAAFGPGGEGYLRMTCVKSWNDLHAGLDRLERGLEDLL